MPRSKLPKFGYRCLFVSQRYNRIDPHCPPHRKPARRQRHSHKRGRDRGHLEMIGNAAAQIQISVAHVRPKLVQNH